MKKDTQGVILLLVGVTVLRLAWGDQYLFYVAEGMRPFLIGSGAVLLGLGGYALWEAYQGSRQSDPALGRDPEEHASEHDHGHDHGRGPRIAYLLLVPVLAVFIVAPSALGSFSAARQGTTSTAPPLDVDLPPLPPGQAELTLRDYVVRAVWDDATTLQGRRVTMTGFVTPDPSGGWWLTRMALACCAADAQASRVKVIDTATDLPADTWVTVTGSWVQGGGLRDPAAIPLLHAAAVRTVPVPRNPYE